MKTKFISIGVTEVTYPIGEFMPSNKHAMFKLANRILKEFPNTKLTLWVRGSSGALIAGIITALASVDVRVVYVYKDNESSHNTFDFSKSLKDSKNLIVDDFTCTFKTIKNIYEYMTEDCQVMPDALCTFGTINGKNMCKCGFGDKFPLIIAPAVWWQGMSIRDDGEYDLVHWDNMSVNQPKQEKQL